MRGGLRGRGGEKQLSHLTMQNYRQGRRLLSLCRGFSSVALIKLVELRREELPKPLLRRKSGCLAPVQTSRVQVSGCTFQPSPYRPLWSWLNSVYFRPSDFWEGVSYCTSLLKWVWLPEPPPAWIFRPPPSTAPAWEGSCEAGIEGRAHISQSSSYWRGTPSPALSRVESTREKVSITGLLERRDMGKALNSCSSCGCLQIFKQS